jgi:hypothetical protein
MNSYCLNLHEKYAPNWGVWECARELFANAKDASPDEMEVHTIDANTLQIYTPTVPNIAELFIIGCGSKSQEDSNIGQFGEGLKLTALVATRKHGGSLTIQLPDQTITFAIREHFGQQVLFADVDDTTNDEGCLCTLVMTGAGYVLNGKVLEDAESHSIPKDPASPVQIFCKGIWIAALDVKDALFSYNLNDIELNRDRSHADPYSIRTAVARLLDDTMDDEMANQLIHNGHSWESDACVNRWNLSTPSRDALASAMFRKYGEKVVLNTGPDSATAAEELGYKVVHLGDGVREALVGKVPLDSEVLARQSGLSEVAPRGRHIEMLDECNKLITMVNVPAAIKLFADTVGGILGKADTDTQTIWLNERLFHTDNRFERIRTVIHELAHIQSGGSDISRSFENSLDLIGGQLAIIALDK